MNRTVQFWRLIQPDGAPLPGRFPAAQVVARLRAAERAGQNRHHRCGDDMVLLAHGFSNADRHMIVLDKVRRDNLPSVGDPAGSRRAIALGRDEGLLEPSYFWFAERNVVALLTSGNGPRARRLVDYLDVKLGIEVSLEPVITKNLDQVLADMRLTEVRVAIPASRIDRHLIDGDWATALEAGRVLAEDGVVHVGISVGRRGNRAFKDQMRARIQQKIAELRGSGSLSEFDSAQVRGSIRGATRAVDLYADKFVETTAVDNDRLADPQRSTDYADELLGDAVRRNNAFLKSVIEPVPDDDVALPDTFNDDPGENSS